MSAKTNLVKTIVSDSEINFPQRKNCRLVGYRFRHKRLKSNSLWNSNNELYFEEGSLVLPSTGNLSKQKMTVPSNSQDNMELWNSNYTFLMDKDLISLCQETIEELKNGVSALNSSQQPFLNCTQFITRFNALHDDLHSLFMIASEENTKAHCQNKIASELQLRLGDYTLLKEQASILELRYPYMKDDIRKRCNILNNKLKALQLMLCPRKHHKDLTFRNLSLRMKAVRKWLRNVGDELRNLVVSENLPVEQIDDIQSQQKMLQREIETRGKEVTSLVRQCASADGATVARAKRLQRAAANIERTWHNVWIRSLETQCYTEQVLKQRDKRQDAHVTQDTTESDFDEGPLTKHRRLTRNSWAASIMSRLPNKPDSPFPKPEHSPTTEHGSQAASRDVGTNFGKNGIIHFSDKGVMVGTTGIAALKAEYGDDFSKIEIIQDVGYSSESSTHLSGDDGFFYYSYDPKHLGPRTSVGGPTLSLRDELDNAILVSKILEDSGHQGGFFDDSGIVGAETVAGAKALEEYEASVESDYLDRVLDKVGINFKDNCNEDEELDAGLNSVDVDEPTDTFHSRTAFTTSAQEFYKMISVDSDNGEQDNSSPDKPNKPTHHNGHTDKDPDNTETKSCVSNDEGEGDAETSNYTDSHNFNLNPPLLCSTPIRPSYSQPSLKRKRHTPVASSGFSTSPVVRGTSEYRSSRISSWLKHPESSWSEDQHPYKRDSSPSSPAFDSIMHPPLSSFSHPSNDDDSSSCDASGEYTSSSSSDECCFSLDLSSDDQPKKQHSRGHLQRRDQPERSRIGSDGSEEILLPPPPPLSPLVSRRQRNSASDSCCCVKLPVGSGDFCLSRGVRKHSRHDLMARGCYSEGESPSKDTLSREYHHVQISSSLLLHHRLSSSLPCLRRPSLHANFKDQNSITTEPRALDSLCPSSTRSLINNSSSTYCCSDTGKKKRRSRKKSCNSEMCVRNKKVSISVFCGGGRHQSSQALLNYVAPLSRRSRHFSETQMVSMLNGEMKCDETEALMARGDNGTTCGVEPLSPVLSPVSDVVLTQLEVQSTVSDQVWDDYQDYPYLSEAYSEATVDEDAVRKLTEFGDDYTAAIGQPNRLDNPDGRHNNNPDGDLVKFRSRKTSKALKPLSSSQRSSVHLDSDSDLEDLHHVLVEARKALNFAKSTLKRRQTELQLTPAEYIDLHATCKTHLHCLKTIRDHTESDVLDKTFSNRDLDRLHELIQEWELLQRCTIMYEKGQNHMQQKYEKAQDAIQLLYDKLSDVSTSIYIDITCFCSWDELKKKLSELQATQSTLQETKEQLLDVNLQVHRFMTEYGEEGSYNSSCLKDKVTELYEQWDEVYRQNGTKLTELQTLRNAFDSYEEKVKKVRVIQNQDFSKSSTVRHSPDNDDYLTKALSELKTDLEYLETHLKGSKLWKSIETNHRDLRNSLARPNKEKGHRIRKEIDSATIASNRPAHPHSSVAAEDDADDKFEDAETDKDVSSDEKTLAKNGAKGHANRFWRVLRTAIPIQIALVLLYCLACYLEPHCCDVLNNFNFSLHPQLRYTKGPPPV